MIEKPKRPKKFDIQDRQIPATIQDLINRYDLENLDIYDFLDYLVDFLNQDSGESEELEEKIEEKIDEIKEKIDTKISFEVIETIEEGG